MKSEIHSLFSSLLIRRPGLLIKSALVASFANQYWTIVQIFKLVGVEWYKTIIYFFEFSQVLGELLHNSLKDAIMQKRKKNNY